MNHKSAATLDLTMAGKELAHLYQQVTQDGQRIEIADGGSHSSCVIISKQELDALEKALEILSNTDSVRELSASLAQAAAAAENRTAVSG